MGFSRNTYDFLGKFLVIINVHGGWLCRGKIEIIMCVYCLNGDGRLK